MKTLCEKMFLKIFFIFFAFFLLLFALTIYFFLKKNPLVKQLITATIRAYFYKRKGESKVLSEKVLKIDDENKEDEINASFHLLGISKYDNYMQVEYTFRGIQYTMSFCEETRLELLNSNISIEEFVCEVLGQQKEKSDVILNFLPEIEDKDLEMAIIKQFGPFGGISDADGFFASLKNFEVHDQCIEIECIEWKFKIDFVEEVITREKLDKLD